MENNAAGLAFMDLADEVVEKTGQRNKTLRPTERLKIN
jgi:hypothetical protein